MTLLRLVLVLLLTFMTVSACQPDTQPGPETPNSETTAADSEAPNDGAEAEEPAEPEIPEGTPNTPAKIEQSLSADVISVLRIGTNRELTEESLNRQEIRVRINQIDPKDFPMVKLLVSVTDVNNNPLRIADPSLFVVKENEELIDPRDIRPVILQREQDELSQERLNLVMAIDHSGSMAWGANREVLPLEDQPISYAKTAASDFIANLDPLKDSCEVVVFNHEIRSLGADTSASLRLPSLEAKGDTALFGALKDSVNRLADKQGIRAVVLMTDGENDMTRQRRSQWYDTKMDDGLAMAERLAIPVFTIAFGAGADTQALRSIADRTQASFFETPDKEELTNIYDNIRRIINNQYVITYYSRSTSLENMPSVQVGGSTGQRNYTLEEEQQEFRKEIEAMDAREQALDEKANALDEKQTSLNELEDTLSQRSSELTIRENAVAELEKEVRERKEELDNRQRTLDDLREQLDALNASLREQEGEIGTTQEQLDARQQFVDSETTRLSNLDRDLTQREEAIELEQANLTRRANELTRAQTELENRQRELVRNETALDERTRALATQEDEVNARLTDLTGRETTVANREQQVTDLEEQLRETRQLLEQRERQLTQLRTTFLSAVDDLGEDIDETRTQLDTP